MDRQFTGAGWSFPVKLNGAGGIAVSRDEDKIRESIILIISTAKGERVMRPEFGCDIHQFAFSVINATTLTRMENAVKEALVMWERRIEIIDITAGTSRLNQGYIDIRINYRIRNTNNEYNCVYPFYLKDGGA